METLHDLLARSPRGLTLEQLADGVNMTTRSVRRYLKEFERDMVLDSSAVRAGGPKLWRVRTTELPRKIELRRTQAYALLAALRVFAPMAGSALYEEIDLAVRRLLDLAHRPGRGPNAGIADARLEERFLYLPFAPKDYAEKHEELDDLFQAVSDLRPLHVSYRGAGKEREDRIVIHPYAMVLHRDSVYCVGLHVQKDEIRTFVLDRMRHTECATTERFTLPEDFKIDDWFQGEFGIWRSAERHRVVVEFDEAAVEYVKMRRVHRTQKLTTIPGGVRLTMTVGDLRQVASWVLEWGARARVIEPPELVERVRGELEAALKGYGKRR